jgi:hypothetical protein
MEGEFEPFLAVGLLHESERLWAVAVSREGCAGDGVGVSNAAFGKRGVLWAESSGGGVVAVARSMASRVAYCF